MNAVDRDVRALLLLVLRFFLASIHEAFEEQIHGIARAQEFGVPLHADRKGLVGVLDGLDQALIVICCCAQFGRELEYPLMMHGVHLGRMRLQDTRQASTRLERYMV